MYPLYLKETPINRKVDIHQYEGGRRIAFIGSHNHAEICEVSFPTVQPVAGYTMTSERPQEMRVDNHGDQLTLEFTVGNQRIAVQLDRADALMMAETIKLIMTGGKLSQNEAIERASLAMESAKHRWADRWIKLADDWDLHIYFEENTSNRKAQLVPVDGYFHRHTFDAIELTPPAKEGK